MPKLVERVQWKIETKEGERTMDNKFTFALLQFLFLASSMMQRAA